MRPEQHKALRYLSKKIGYVFQNPDLGLMAITHGSYNPDRLKTNYQRLEFLGDRVLGLITAERLYQHSIYDEGAMAQILNILVSRKNCAKIARKINLDKIILVSRDIQKHNISHQESIIGDVCEALIAALYLDGGLAQAREFYDKFWQEEFEMALNDGMKKDAKTELQERAARMGVGSPVYHLVAQTGLAHDPEFEIKVCVSSIGMAQGRGRTKKMAETEAAARLLEKWQD